MIEFAGNEEITYVYRDEKNDDQLMYTILNRYIFSSWDDVMEAFDINIKDEIDFSRLDTDAYYSSAADDQSSGRIMILDNHFFDQYLQIFNFKTFNKIEECKSIDHYIHIVCKEKVTIVCELRLKYPLKILLKISNPCLSINLTKYLILSDLI